MPGRTTVAIDGERFLIDGQPTYQGRSFQGQSIEGLLMNVRAVQATFDDLNPETRARWAYPETGVWDPDRNVREFLAALPTWHEHGLLAVTVNFQGGSPEGYSRQQPWENSAFEPDGRLRQPYLDRMARVLERADELGMVVIVGCFYQGQDERLVDEKAVTRAVENAVGWLLDGGWTNVIVEITNECDVPRIEQAILRPDRAHELIRRAQSMTANYRRLLVSTSFRGGTIPPDNVLEAADLALIHGNGVTDPAVMTWLVERTRHRSGVVGKRMPIVVNEDDHFDFDKPSNNLLAAVRNYASWGYFDAGPGSGGAGAHGNYRDGYQLVPVSWSIDTETKRGFFDLLRQVTGGA
ncbi:MAG: hypothetical protein IT305_05115 [Chloroflexi bacterium]|nr:hypothetical protein [Chloroflexota bacterium]